MTTTSEPAREAGLEWDDAAGDLRPPRSAEHVAPDEVAHAQPRSEAARQHDREHADWRRRLLLAVLVADVIGVWLLVYLALRWLA